MKNKILSLCFLLTLSLLTGLQLSAQTIYTNTYINHNSDGPVLDNSGSIDVSNCGSISFSVVYNFSLPWEGSGNMEYCDERNDNGNYSCGGCSCDPANPVSGGCSICWDFLWVVFKINGEEIGGDLIGDSGTTNAEQSGTISSESICIETTANASIDVTTQTWAANEKVTYTSMLICHEKANVTANASAVCSGDPVTLTANGGATYQWSDGLGNTASVTAYPVQTTTYSVTITDDNGCESTTEVTATVDEIDLSDVTIACTTCDICSDEQPSLSFDLPSGTFSVTYTDGTNTYTNDVSDGETITVPNTYDSNTTFSIVSINQEENDCTWNGPFDQGEISINVNSLSPPTLDSFGPYCELDDVIQLPSIQDGITGTWSGSGITENEFDSSVANSGDWTFTPDDGQCSSVATTAVVINAGGDFLLNWTSVENAEYYILEVAYDENFTQLVPTLSGVLVNATEFQVSDLPVGNYCYRIRSSQYGLLSEYSNVVCFTIDESCNVGAECNDENPCTINDKYDADCNCEGTEDTNDSDGDGIPDACDDEEPCLVGGTCNDGEDCTINDVYDDKCNCAGTIDPNDIDADEIPDACDPLINTPCQAGDPCNDANACTLNDVYDIDCNCAGTQDTNDSDGNGIPDACDNEEPCDVGSPCDDGEDCTVNDVFNEACICEGTQDTNDLDEDEIPDVCDDNIDSPCEAGTACDDGEPCTINDVYTETCQCAGTLDTNDSDGDDIPDACDDEQACVVGALCNDGDNCTVNDVFNEVCICMGTRDTNDLDGDEIPDACDDNIDSPCEAGTACDDGEPCTINDVYDIDCNCAGTLDTNDSDGDDIPDACDDEESCVVGSPCDDEEDCTINDVYDQACNCAGTLDTNDSDGDEIPDACDEYTAPIEPPIALEATNLQPTTFMAHWQGTTEEHNFILDVSTDPNFATMLPGYDGLSITGDNLNIEGIDLQNETYYYRVREVAPNGTISEFSNVITVMPPIPQPPIMVAATNMTATSFIANWTGEGTYYILEVATDNGFIEIVQPYDEMQTPNLEQLMEGLVTGTTYFIRVRAMTPFGLSDYSNILEVTIGEIPEPPIALEALDVTRSTFLANWVQHSTAETYLLEIASDPDFSNILADYDNLSTTELEQAVSDLDNTITYYYRIRVENDLGISDYSNVIEVELSNYCSIAQEEEFDYNCGNTGTLTPDFPVLPLLTELKEGDTILASEFLVIIDEVMGTSPFTGTGHFHFADMPEEVQVNVIFADIEVDESCRMVGGLMNVEGIGVALLDEEIIDAINEVLAVLETIDDVLAVAEAILTEISQVLNTSEAVGDYFSDGWNLLEGSEGISNEYPYMPDSLLTNLDEAIACFSSGASPSTCQDAFAEAIMNIVSELEETYNNPPSNNSQDADSTAADASKQVVFIENSEQDYGFDTLQYPALAEFYNSFQIHGADYNVAWKSVATGQTDIVDATLRNGDSVPSTIRFEDNEKNEIDKAGNTLTISAKSNNDVHPIYALEGEGDDVKISGKLSVITYDDIPINVVLVPVNSNNYPYNVGALQNKLNEIYDPAVVTLNVTVADNLTISEFDNTLDTMPSGLLSAYNSDMNDIIDAYKDEVGNSNIAEDTYYLFMINASQNPNKLGVMPKKRQFGFIFLNAHGGSEDLLSKTIAHELGHGAFILDHPWENYSDLTRGSTDNLMDYGGADAVTLHKYQWHIIHNPSYHATLFDDEEEGESSILARQFIYQGNIYYKYEGESDCFTCITPSKHLFGLPSTAVAAFNPVDTEWPAGCLVGFDYQNLTYVGWSREEGEQNLFIGYAPITYVNGYSEPNTNMWFSSCTTDSDNVHAGISNNCDVAILRGALSAPTYVYDNSNHEPIQDKIDEIDDFQVIETSVYLTDVCLGGESEWCGEAYADHPYLNPACTDPICRVVQANPCLIGTLEHHNFVPYEPSPWMEDVKNIAAAMTAFGFLPAAIEAALSIVIQEFGRERISDAVVAFNLDLVFQMFIKYYFPPNGQEITWLEARENLDYFTATTSAVETVLALEFSNPYAGAVITASSGCITGGFTSNGQINEDFSPENCATNAGINLAVYGAFQGMPWAKNKLQQIPKERLVNGLFRLFGEGLPPGTHVAGGIPPHIKIRIYRWLHTSDMLPIDVKVIFNISNDADATQIANLINSNLSLRENLLDSGLWETLRNATSDVATRTELLKDLVENVNLAAAFRENFGLVNAWGDMFAINVPKALRTNVSFLTRLSDKPNLINFINNLSDAGQTQLAQNVDDWIKLYDVRTYLKTGNYNNAVNILGGNLISPQVYNGANYTGVLTSNQIADFNAIINSTTEYIQIANNLGIDVTIVQTMKQHLFVTEHLVEVSPGNFVQGRFATFQHIADWWNQVKSGNLSNGEYLKKLISHEYIEAKLMQEGMVYRTLDNPSSYKYGAHELSSHEGDFNFNHWGLMGRDNPPFNLASNLSNIDDIVSQIKNIEGL